MNNPSANPCFSGRQKTTPPNDLRRALELCVQKTRTNIKDFTNQPTTTWSHDVAGYYEKYQEGFYDIGNWTTSFFTGMALLAWRETEDEYFVQQTLRLAPLYHEKAVHRFLDMHHDAGFLYSLYSVGLYKLTGDKAHRDVGIAAANALAQRFNEKGNFIRAWGRLDSDEHANMAIIDCLMNLPLLHWASAETGDQRYRHIAIKHADMALQCFIRPDGSINHAYRFDLETGKPIGPDNFCGFNQQSHWARGATWAIYGFALSYGYTCDQRYLDASVRVAKKFIAQLDAAVVPVWDFKLPAEATRECDASAAAIMVCALQELEKLHAADESMRQIKSALLTKICTDEFLDHNPECRGVLKKCQTGNGLGKARHSYTSWGDYFLMEALTRELNLGEPFW